MRFNLWRELVVAALALQATSALAIFDVQVMAGKRWYQLKGDFDENVASQEVAIAAHIDPIPAVPVAFGVSAAMGTLNKDDVGDGVKEATTLEAGLDLMAWVPMVPVVTPYGRLKYPFMGAIALESENEVSPGVTEKTAISYEISGPTIGVGVKWSPLPILDLLVEVQRGMQKYDLDEYKVDGVKQSGDVSGDLQSDAVLLGLEIGL